ncbi:hypothetical protein ALC56_02563 [Trachymyrmex septentrionalis]|uniref:Uncharacterized protein n=1 Tax=Trachymyrmex septentrionalis TaxID=34720 RepID=A0A195FQQ8_9HYME|nr:hypothetical protein ALC56_02563 [Trachymyrmex septentrionalis]
MASISRRGVTDSTQRKFNRKDFYGTNYALLQIVLRIILLYLGNQGFFMFYGRIPVCIKSEARSQTSNGAFVTTLDPHRAPTCTPCLYRATNCLRNENIVPVNK